MNNGNGYNNHANHGQFMKMFRAAFPNAPRGEAEAIYTKERCESLYPSYQNMYRLALNHTRHKHTAYEVEMQACIARLKAKFNLKAADQLDVWAAVEEEVLHA